VPVSVPTWIAPILLLTCSNVFMTLAWYGHLKFTDKPLWLVIAASWGIALVEYCFAVPANRIGAEHGYSLAQLKVIQEVITLTVFAGFAVLVMGEKLKWNHGAAALCLVAAVGFVFIDKLKLS
jgi:hypothetical protein